MSGVKQAYLEALMKKLDKYPNLMSRPEVAEALGWKVGRVRTLTETGAIPSTRVGKNVAVAKADVIELLAGAASGKAASA